MFFGLLCRIVVRLAQRLERPIPKLVGVAVVSLDVVADRGNSDAALQPAHTAKRFNRQLMLAGTFPTRKLIPAAPLARLV